jgi:hypothetical protein
MPQYSVVHSAVRCATMIVYLQSINIEVSDVRREK